MEILRFFRPNLNLLWEPYFITITGNGAWGNFVDKSQQELKNFVSRSKLKDLIITVRNSSVFVRVFFYEGRIAKISQVNGYLQSFSQLLIFT